MNHKSFSICWHLLLEEDSYWLKHRHQDDRAEENKWESNSACWKMKSEADDELLSQLSVTEIHADHDWSFFTDEMLWDLLCRYYVIRHITVHDLILIEYLKKSLWISARSD